MRSACSYRRTAAKFGTCAQRLLCHVVLGPWAVLCCAVLWCAVLTATVLYCMYSSCALLCWQSQTETRPKSLVLPIGTDPRHAVTQSETAHSSTAEPRILNGFFLLSSALHGTGESNKVFFGRISLSVMRTLPTVPNRNPLRACHRDTAAACVEILRSLFWLL